MSEDADLEFALLRSLRRKLRQNPLLRQPLKAALRQLADDPFHPSLHSHQLKGDLATWNNRRIEREVQARRCCLWSNKAVIGEPVGDYCDERQTH